MNEKTFMSNAEKRRFLAVYGNKVCEIITCSECKYFKNDGFDDICTYDYHHIKRKPDDFCSRGEKMKGETINEESNNGNIANLYHNDYGVL